MCSDSLVSARPQKNHLGSTSEIFRHAENESLGNQYHKFTDARIYEKRGVTSAAVLWFERLLLLCGVAGAVGSTLLLRSRAARPAAA